MIPPWKRNTAVNNCRMADSGARRPAFASASWADCDQGLPATVAGPFDLILISHLLSISAVPTGCLTIARAALLLMG